MRQAMRLPVAVLAVGAMIGTSACASWNNKEKGAVIGAGTGAAVGAVVGNQVGSTAKGAIVGAAVGGAAGAIIGHQMDQQAKSIEQSVEGATVSRVGEGIVVTFDNGILFDFDSSNLRPTARDNLGALADNLRRYPNTDVSILGHTDATGSDPYNQALSQRRASSAAEYLRTMGVAPGRISTRGLGESDPVASNDTAEGRQLNRRVEVVIYADKQWRNDLEQQHPGL